jgi:hypothetical protein
MYDVPDGVSTVVAGECPAPYTGSECCAEMEITYFGGTPACAAKHGMDAMKAMLLGV